MNQFHCAKVAKFSLYIAKMADFEVDIEVRCVKSLFGKVLELGVKSLW